MTGWLDLLGPFERWGEPVILVTIVGVRGSTPREVGARLIVGADRVRGTIGGGNLEYQAIALGREMLRDEEDRSTRLEMPLGPTLGQCCGGHVTLHFERIELDATNHWLEALDAAAVSGAAAVLATDIVAPRARHWVVTEDSQDSDAAGEHRAILQQARGLLAGGSPPEQGRIFYELLRPAAMNVVLFGAGHVGQAIVRVMADVPARVEWVDERKEQFPDELPGNVVMRRTYDPERVIDEAPPGSFFVVMTHSHALDLDLVEAILRRGDFGYLGLIGSATKRARFERQLRSRGIAERQFARLTCPIGVRGIGGKEPGVIAVAVVAELLRLHETVAVRGQIGETA